MHENLYWYTYSIDVFDDQDRSDEMDYLNKWCAKFLDKLPKGKLLTISTGHIYEGEFEKNACIIMHICYAYDGNKDDMPTKYAMKSYKGKDNEKEC